MTLETVKARGLVLIGCGRMGSAMLKGWLDGGLPATSITVHDPQPSAWLNATGVQVNAALPANPAVVILAVKPQMMGDTLPQLQALGGSDTIFLSVAAGITIATYEEILGSGTPIVRAMPNTPAAIGRGITGIVGNSETSPDQLGVAETLLHAVGEVVQLENEAQIRALTAVSGCGPAYVFHLIETMAAAGEAAGLPTALALQLARSTVAGAGALAMESDDSPTQLRVNVTSPNGVTAEALTVLMDADTGLPPLMDKTIKAAVARDAELAS